MQSKKRFLSVALLFVVALFSGCQTLSDIIVSVQREVCDAIRLLRDTQTSDMTVSFSYSINSAEEYNVIVQTKSVIIDGGMRAIAEVYSQEAYSVQYVFNKCSYVYSEKGGVTKTSVSGYDPSNPYRFLFDAHYCAYDGIRIDESCLTFKNYTYSRVNDGGQIKYGVVSQNADLEKLWGGMFGMDFITGNLVLNIWQNPEKSVLYKVSERVTVYNNIGQTSKLSATLDITFNTAGNNVEVEIPQNVVDLIEDYLRPASAG